MASTAFLKRIAQWEQEHGRHATLEDQEQILRDFLAQFGIYERADGYYHREDFEETFARYLPPKK